MRFSDSVVNRNRHFKDGFLKALRNSRFFRQPPPIGT